MDRKDTIIVVGDSPFLKEVEDKVYYVVDRYYSIGINNIVDKVKTSEHAFLDFYQVAKTNKHPDIKTTTLKHYRKVVQKDNVEFFNTFTFEPEKPDIIRKGELAYCGFTHDFVLSYCILKGWKNIVLIGTADFIEGPHYALGTDFVYSRNLLPQTIGFISDFCTKHANIFTCNPKSSLTVPRISIEELLK